MAFESIRKNIANFLGLMRLARIIGFWNFFSSVVKTIWYKPRIRHFDHEGIPIPIIGCMPVARYRQLIGEDLANFKTRDDDVFVVSYAKSGHHWSYDFINMLLRGNLELDNVVKEAFFIEFLLPAADGMSAFDRLPSPRMIFTHFHADALPREVFHKKRKIVRLIRNPKDVAVSAFYHRKNMPNLAGSRFFDWNGYIEALMDVLENKVDSEEVCEELFMAKNADWFTYELDCEAKLNHLDHSVVLYYEDLKEDMVPQLRKLARFLGREYGDEFLAKIAAKTNLRYVKKHKDLGMHDVLIKKEGLYRKGVIGDWKNHFTEEQSRRFDAIIQRKMNGCSIMDNIRYEAME